MSDAETLILKRLSEGAGLFIDNHKIKGLNKAPRETQDRLLVYKTSSKQTHVFCNRFHSYQKLRDNMIVALPPSLKLLVPRHL